MAFYLLQENGSKILLEDGSGALLLEATIPGPSVDWQAGGAGYPLKRRRNATEDLFKEIERALEVALGIIEVPVDDEAAAVVEEAPQPTWSEARLHAALSELGRIGQRTEVYAARFERLQAMVRAYEEAQARERALQDDEEAWFLLT